MILIGAEILLRLLYAENLTTPSRPLIYQYDSVTNYKYIPDTIFNILEESYRINKNGFLGHNFSDNNKLFKIAIVGSSSVAGSINKSKLYNFCTFLQDRFNKEKQLVEVLNCGIDGNERSLDIFKSIHQNVLELNPDLILLEYGLPFETRNAVREIYKGYIISYPSTDIGKEHCMKYVDTLKKYENMIDVLYNSYIMRAMFSALGKSGIGDLKLYTDLYRSRILIYGRWTAIEYSLIESVDMVKSLQNELTQKNINFFLFQTNNDKDVKIIAKDSSLPLISLNPKLNENDFWYNDEHWNENGCRKLADNLWEILTKYHLYEK